MIIFCLMHGQNINTRYRTWYTQGSSNFGINTVYLYLELFGEFWVLCYMSRTAVSSPDRAGARVVTTRLSDRQYSVRNERASPNFQPIEFCTGKVYREERPNTARWAFENQSSQPSPSGSAAACSTSAAFSSRRRASASALASAAASFGDFFS